MEMADGDDSLIIDETVVCINIRSNKNFYFIFFFKQSCVCSLFRSNIYKSLERNFQLYTKFSLIWKKFSAYSKNSVKFYEL